MLPPPPRSLRRPSRSGEGGAALPAAAPALPARRFCVFCASGAAFPTQSCSPRRDTGAPGCRGPLCAPGAGMGPPARGSAPLLRRSRSRARGGERGAAAGLGRAVSGLGPRASASARQGWGTSAAAFPGDRAGRAGQGRGPRERRPGQPLGAGGSGWGEPSLAQRPPRGPAGQRRRPRGPPRTPGPGRNRGLRWRGRGQGSGGGRPGGAEDSAFGLVSSQSASRRADNGRPRRSWGGRRNFGGAC